jgi:transcriptional regulator with XRE-family HTH domain
MNLLDTSRIKELREGRGLSQEEAARIAGVGGRQNWNAIENGRKANITLETLAAVAKALGVKAKELLK